MKEIEKSLASDIRRLCGDGSREARQAMNRALREAATDMSSTAVAGGLEPYIKAHGRAAVACVLAATIFERRNRLNREPVEWAMAVLEIWKGRTKPTHDYAYNDGLHPTKVEDYARGFIRSTSM